MVLRAMHAALASRIYTNGAQPSASGAVFPDAPSLIPNIGAEFLGFTSKSVEVWPNLPPAYEPWNTWQGWMSEYRTLVATAQEVYEAQYGKQGEDRP